MKRKAAAPLTEEGCCANDEEQADPHSIHIANRVIHHRVRRSISDNSYEGSNRLSKELKQEGLNQYQHQAVYPSLLATQSINPHCTKGRKGDDG